MSTQDRPPAPKPERNSPCPCGSGKKYKKCHLLIERQEQADYLAARKAVFLARTKSRSSQGKHTLALAAMFWGVGR